MIVLYILVALIVLANFHPSHISVGKKLNPIWWLLNDDDPINQKKYDKRYPGRPHWYRVMRHAMRNPLANFCRYVIGFKDKQSWLRQADQWPEGKQEPAICFTLPWISFRIIWGIHGYAGWNVGHNPDGMNQGAFSLCLRRQ